MAKSYMCESCKFRAKYGRNISGALCLAVLLVFFWANSNPLGAQGKDLLATNGEKVEKLRKMNPFKDKTVKRYVKDSLQTLISRCETVLKAAYMKGEHVATHYDVPGWEGFPVEEYTYYTGKDGAARAFADEMVASGTVDAIRAEDGNLRYEYFFPMEDEETVLLIDRWEDQAAIDAHHKSEMMGRIAALRDKYRLRMRVERYQAL